MPEKSTTPPTFNVWQVIAGSASALLVAAIIGLFASYAKEGAREEKLIRAQDDIKELKLDLKELASDQKTHEDKCDEKFSTVSNLSDGIRELKEAANRQQPR